jgi:hypothetical protein
MDEFISKYKWYIIAAMVILGVLCGTGAPEFMGNPDK